MEYNNNTYTIISTDSLTAVTYTEVLQTSIDTVRPNNDGTQHILSYVGFEPASLIPITKINALGRDYHTHEEMLLVVALTGITGWTSEEII